MCCNIIVILAKLCAFVGSDSNTRLSLICTFQATATRHALNVLLSVTSQFRHTDNYKKVLTQDVGVIPVFQHNRAASERGK